MQKFERVLDYIIEQANRDDAKSLQFEQDIIFMIEKSRDKAFNKMVSRSIGCETILDMQKLLNILTPIMQSFLYEIKSILSNKFKEYSDIAYNNTNQLIEIGLDIEHKFSQNITEISILRDETTIDYIQTHSYEMLTGYSNNIIQQLRSNLGDLILKGNADRATVQKSIENILGVHSSKAVEIAQTELSRAYNFGILNRLSQYQKETGENVRKYWHGFKYSQKTCSYCIDRIGKIYELNDNTEQLPAHPRCRCVWLPVLNGWDKPVNIDIISRANMLVTGYSEEQIYSRINSRLGIDYSEYLKIEDAIEYLEGNRTPLMMSKISIAREQAINVTKDNMQIQSETGSDIWSKKFNQQMGFWKTTVAESIVDNNKDLLNKCYDGLKAVMLLPWSSQQLSKWDKLLNSVDKARS